ncbi:hypothetical protein F4780DRAFT_353373 [Xylariomycetidae sp. FL0641]|nr:hypothetical protein F4780DRAFT_353373 [Xylariomycetidae sp. FL0641]
MSFHYHQQPIHQQPAETSEPGIRHLVVPLLGDVNNSGVHELTTPHAGADRSSDSDDIALPPVALPPITEAGYPLHLGLLHQLPMAEPPMAQQDLASHVAVRPRSRRPDNWRPDVWRLLLLPQEIFDEIISYLAPAHVLSLALVNKELLCRFVHSETGEEHHLSDLQAGAAAENVAFNLLVQASKRSFNPFIRRAEVTKAKVRGSFLSLVDNDVMDLVYCYKCKTLHDPFVSFKDRGFHPTKARRCMDWPDEHHMPPRATRKLLRSIMKRRRAGAEYRSLLQEVNNTQTIYHQIGILSQTTLRCRFRNNDLLLRRQQVISSIDKTPLSLWIFGQQLQDHVPPGCVPIATPKVYRICNHLTWNAAYYGQYLKRWADALCNRGCVGYHKPSCFKEPTLFDASMESTHTVAERLRMVVTGAHGKPTDVPDLLGNVLLCSRCTTDFSLDVIPLPAPFHWGFVLTTWLDLGPMDFCPKWDSHRDLRPGRDFRRSFNQPDICERFEDCEWRNFRPVISELNLARMGADGWGQRAASGLDRYEAWSRGHKCNPATGRLNGPDPLEEADY